MWGGILDFTGMEIIFFLLRLIFFENDCSLSELACTICNTLSYSYHTFPCSFAMDGQGRNVVSSFIIYVPGITTCVLVLYRRTTSRSSSTVQCTVGPISFNVMSVSL